MNSKKGNLVLKVCRNIALVIVFISLTICFGYSAQIAFMAGDVKVVRDGKNLNAQFQMKLETGDVVKTGKSSFADVSYEDGTVVKINENSSVTVGNKSAKGSDSLSVTSGIISAKFAKLEKDSTRKIYTPTAVCAVRGTEFNVAVSESADSKVQLKEGALEVNNPYGKTAIKENQNVEVNVAKGPVESDATDLGKWKAENEAGLDSNPEQKSDSFSQYVKDFGKRNESASRKISNLEKKRMSTAKGGKDKLEKANMEIESIENDVKDDLYLNAAADNSIDGILNRYQKDKKGMYDKYLQIKKESNKVLEQQKKNYESIMSVKEAYRKAYEDIKGKHKGAMDKIKGSYDKEGVKPKK